MADSQPSLGTVFRAVGRVCYTDALTLAWSSVLCILGSVPLVTTGASVLALTETWLTVINTETEGRTLTERRRLKLFIETWRANIRSGIPYGIVLVVVLGGSYAYLILSSVGGSGLYLVWTLLSLYLVVIVLGWEFRAASIRMRSPNSDRPGFREAMERGAYSLVERPGYTVLQFVGFGGVLLLAGLFPPAFVALGPGIIAVSESVGFEELFGDGAERIRAAYAR